MWKKGRMPSVRQVSSICACASTWRVTATRLRCVSITPFGRPEVPLEYGSTTRSFRGSMVTAGGSPSLSRSAANGVALSIAGGASPNTKISRTDEPRAAPRAASDLSLRERSPAGPVDEDGPIGAIARVPEDEARVRHVGDGDVRVRAAKDHGRAYPIRHDTRTRSRAGQAEDTRGAGVRAANDRAG